MRFFKALRVETSSAIKSALQTLDQVVALWQFYIDAMVDAMLVPYIAAEETMIELAEVEAMIRYFEVSDLVQFPNEVSRVAAATATTGSPTQITRTQSHSPHSQSPAVSLPPTFA